METFCEDNELITFWINETLNAIKDPYNGYGYDEDDDTEQVIKTVKPIHWEYFTITQNNEIVQNILRIFEIIFKDKYQYFQETIKKEEPNIKVSFDFMINYNLSHLIYEETSTILRILKGNFKEYDCIRTMLLSISKINENYKNNSMDVNKKLHENLLFQLDTERIRKVHLNNIIKFIELVIGYGITEEEEKELIIKMYYEMYINIQQLK